MIFTILIDTPDRAGLIYEVSSVFLALGFNIEHSSEFVDRESGHFFMRTVIKDNAQQPSLWDSQDSRRDFRGVDSQLKDSPESTQKAAIYDNLAQKLPQHSRIQIFGESKKSVVVFCTKESHCLGDLLIRHDSGELEIRAVISNHRTLENLVSRFGIPYFCYPSGGASRGESLGGESSRPKSQHGESKSPDSPADSPLALCWRLSPSLIVLAKYMQILPPAFVAAFWGKIINIHHSFLPAFIGANPYRQAFERGVKIIGATAHFVSDELDGGPIICQDTMQVDHNFSAKAMQKAGKNIERAVLSRALDLALDNRIFIYQNKTIVF